jgi:hypothetical protein
MGQWIVIVPSENLVVVRMGFSHGNAGEMSSVAQLVSEIVRSLHETSVSRESPVNPRQGEGGVTKVVPFPAPSQSP